MDAECSLPPFPGSRPICPLCHGDLIRRSCGRKKELPWWGCAGYPACPIRIPDCNGRPARHPLP